MVRNLLMTAVACVAMGAVVAAGYLLPPPPPSHQPDGEHYLTPPCLAVDTADREMIRKIPTPMS